MLHCVRVTARREVSSPFFTVVLQACSRVERTQSPASFHAWDVGRLLVVDLFFSSPGFTPAGSALLCLYPCGSYSRQSHSNAPAPPPHQHPTQAGVARTKMREQKDCQWHHAIHPRKRNFEPFHGNDNAGSASLPSLSHSKTKPDGFSLERGS